MQSVRQSKQQSFKAQDTKKTKIVLKQPNFINVIRLKQKRPKVPAGQPETTLNY